MLGAHVVVVETVGFFPGKGQDLLCAWCKIIHHFGGLPLRSLMVSREYFLSGFQNHCNFA